MNKQNIQSKNILIESLNSNVEENPQFNTNQLLTKTNGDQKIDCGGGMGFLPLTRRERKRNILIISFFFYKFYFYTVLQKKISFNDFPSETKLLYIFIYLFI